MAGPTQLHAQLGDYYTLQGAAAALGRSYWTVYRYVRLTGIPTRRIGNVMLVKLADLHELRTPATFPVPHQADTTEAAQEPAQQRPRGRMVHIQDVDAPLDCDSEDA